MVYSRETAARRAEASKTFGKGWCQLWTRTMFGAPSAGDRDHDGDADAIDGWKSETKQHPGDRHPPRGVPVAFTNKFGHRAMSLGNGVIRGTDMRDGKYSPGNVGNATIDQIEKAMGVKYLGWSETITGITIPKSSNTPAPPKPPVQVVSFFLDLSHYQFENGFKLKMAWDQGYRHVVLKCTQGVKNFDPTYRAAVTAAKELGLSVAAYHFLESGDAAAQAKNTADHIIDKGIPVHIDVEPTGKSKPNSGDWVKYRDAAKKLGLKVVSKYLTEAYWAEIGSPSLVGPLLLWRAAYPTMNHDYASKLYPGNNHKRWNSFGGQKPTFWQFSSAGKVNGYNGNVDVNAFRGTHEELDKLGVFKKMTKTTTPPAPKPPAPKPTPKPKPTKAKFKEFTVHLVPGNKNQKPEGVKADMKMVLDKTGGGSAVVFNTERATTALRTAVSDGLGKGYTRVRENENTMALGPNWSVESSQALLLASEDPAMKGVSPRRYLNVVFAENKYFENVQMAFMGTHLVSEANCIHVNVKGRKWREKTWKIQVADIMAELKRVHELGLPIVLAGDLNTGVKFTSKQLFAEIQKVFGKNAVAVHTGQLDAIYFIGTDKVKLEEMGVEKLTDNRSDHDMVSAEVKATLL